MPNSRQFMTDVVINDNTGTPVDPLESGAAITTQTLEAGGSGITGWLSSLRKAVTDRLGTLGQKAMAASTPVVIASDQSNVPVIQAVPAAPSAAYAPSLYTNWGVDITHNVKASAGNVFGVMATSINASVRYLQLHNTATVPAGGATPLRSWVVPSGTTNQPAILAISRQYLADTGYFGTGIAFAFSTTQATYTAATAADHSIEVEYI